MQVEKPQDFVIATGQSHSLQEFTAAVFSELNLNWRDHVEINQNYFRPSDLIYSRGDPTKAEVILDWKAKTQFSDLIKQLILNADDDSNLK